ncbi:MAG: hypothetical protein U0R50_10045 [Gaiellales bacterium]
MRRSRLIAVAAALPIAIIAIVGVIHLVREPARDEVTPQGGSVLNPHPAAGPFERNGTKLDDCETATEPRACYEQAFGNLAYETDAKTALAAAVDAGRTNSGISSDCHRIAHTIGAAVLARYDGDVSNALAEGDSTCWSGFYHGLLERALAPARSTGELGRMIRNLCDPTGKNWPAFTHYQCLHGIGHGLMLRTGYQRDMSLELCTRLPDDWSQQSCDGGVFMEGFSPSLGDQPPPFDRKDPLAPCPVVADRHKLYCYLQIADNLVRGYEYDWQRVARACRRAESDYWTDICYQSYGRQASGNNYGNPQAVADLCDVAGRRGEIECVYGAVRDMVSNAAGAAPARGFCAVVGDRAVNRCFEGAGTIIGTLETSPEAIRAACEELTTSHLESCTGGAGLRS